MTALEELTFRRPAPEDIEGAADVFAAEEKAVRGEVTMGADELRDWWRLFNLDEGSWLVENEDGEPIGVCGSLERGDEVNCWIAVRPEYQGRGVSAELLRRAERRAREIGGTSVKAGMLAGNERARLLLEGIGFAEARRFYRMQIDFHRPPPAPDPVEGITIAAFQPDDARTFHAAINEGFADDWGFIPQSFEEWKTRRLEAPETDTSLWFIAWDGDAAAGVIRCEAGKFGGGFVGALTVRKPWRGRGIGMALLRHAFEEFHRRGEPHVSLGVDAYNRSGATRLYERAGMRVVSEDIVFEKKLA
ncbi:MAG TPA: GNAT family N-acetyltransferase [Gaiellaceae bacterium]|nr:GNAT family N-acetyltransferase [Gaiellaceae bacterium]